MILSRICRSFAVTLHKVKDTRLRIRASLFGHIDALAESDHQGVQEAVLLLFVVVFTEERLDGLGGAFSMVERNATEKVVNHMVVDNFVEEVTANESGCAIDSSQCALGVGPGFRGVVGNVGVGVLKVGDSN